jgi:hypothetical protein
MIEKSDVAQRGRKHVELSHRIGCSSGQIPCWIDPVIIGTRLCTIQTSDTPLRMDCLCEASGWKTAKVLYL